MLLTIHNLPSTIQYGEIKLLIQSKCGLTNVILDNLVREGNTKKVTVGLSEEEDAAILVKKFNGLYVQGQQLYVEDVRTNKPKQQQFMSVKDLIEESQKQRDIYEQVGFQPKEKQQNDYQNQQMFQGYSNMVQQNPMMMMPMDLNMPMQSSMYYNYFGMSQLQTPYQGFGDNQAPMNQFPENQVQQNQSYAGNARESDLQGNNTNWNTDQTSYGTIQPSPSRDWSNKKDKRMSRWNAPNPENRDSRRRSRSPQWNNTRNTFEATASFSNDYCDREQPRENYSRQKTVAYTETFTSNSFRNPNDSGNADEYFPNVLGDHVTDPKRESDSHFMDQTRNERNQWDAPQRNDRKQIWDEPKPFPPRNDRNRRDGPKSVPTRNSDRNVLRPPRPETRRQFQTTSLKRQYDRRDDRGGPEEKKFAGNFHQQEDRPRPSRPRERYQPFPLPAKPTKGPMPLKNKNGPRPFLPQNNQGKDVRRDNNFQGPSLAAKQQTLANKDVTWRCQAASEIGKDMLKNLEISDMKQQDDILIKLKLNIRKRIEDMLETRSVIMPEIVKLYRLKYPADTDQEFFVTVVENMKKEGADVDKKGNDKAGVKPEPKTPAKANEKKSSETETSAQKAPVKANEKKSSETQPSAQMAPVKANEKKSAVNETTIKMNETTVKKQIPYKPLLPVYPNADKKFYTQQKQIQKKELQDDKMYNLPPKLQRAVDEEADIICDLFMGECQPDDTEDEKKVAERIMDHAADDFRKLIRLHLTKRLLNIKTGLQVRIFGVGKQLKRSMLEEFLKKYGVTSLKKSTRKKMFIANCNSFKCYDALCKLESTVVGNVTINFKPLHIIGPPLSLTQMQILQHRKSMAHNLIEDTDEFIMNTNTTNQEQTDCPNDFTDDNLDLTTDEMDDGDDEKDDMPNIDVNDGDFESDCSVENLDNVDVNEDDLEDY